MMRSVGCVFAAILVIAIMPTSASASRNDVAATQTYLLAEYQLDQATFSNLPASRRSVTAFVGKVASKCPNVLMSPPRNEQLGELLQQELFALGIVASGPDRRAVMAFVHVVKRLRWNDPRFRRLVRERTRGVSLETNAAVPNLCADYGAWATSGYRIVPANTKRFLTQMSASEPDVSSAKGTEPVQNAIRRLLAPNERSSMQLLSKQIERVESSIENAAVEIILGASAALSKALGLESGLGSE